MKELIESILREIGEDPKREGLEKTYKWVHDAYLRRYGGHLGPRVAAPRGTHAKPAR